MWTRRLARTLWVATVAYWPLQVLVARSWPTPYSVRENLISDLGAVTCTEVCSPDHATMNATFVGVGGATAAGAALLITNARTGAGRLGYTLVAVSGLATVAVGFLPLDTHPTAHTFAAQVHFATQAAGMAALVAEYRSRRPVLATWTLTTLVIALVGGVAFISPGHWGLGAGWSERLAIDTLTVWTVGTGLGLITRRRAIAE